MKENSGSVKKESIKVIVADDSELFLEGIKAIFSTTEDFDIIKTFTDGSKLVSSTQLQQADIIFIDINMPVMNGIEAAKRINYLNINLPLVAITMHQDDIYLQEMIGAGFRGYIYKPNVATTVFDVIKKVINNKLAFPKNLKT